MTVPNDYLYKRDTLLDIWPILLEGADVQRDKFLVLLGPSLQEVLLLRDLGVDPSRLVAVDKENPEMLDASLAGWTYHMMLSQAATRMPKVKAAHVDLCCALAHKNDAEIYALFNENVLEDPARVCINLHKGHDEETALLCKYYGVERPALVLDEIRGRGYDAEIIARDEYTNPRGATMYWTIFETRKETK
jgi:hypothetical protein